VTTPTMDVTLERGQGIVTVAVAAGDYAAFLLRLWRSDKDCHWRVSLIPVGNEDEPRHFANLDELQAFLRALE